MMNEKARNEANTPDTLEQWQEKSCQVAHRAGRQLRSIADAASGEMHEVTDAALDEIRRHPLRTTALVAAAGFVLGALFGRRS